MANTLYLLLGTNLGNRLAYLKTAWAGIEQHIGSIRQASAVYETEPWGVTNQPAYLNQVVVVETSQDVGQVLDTIHVLEKEAGRQRRIRWEARPIDIDILYMDDQIVDRPHLTIPHPRLAERRFVLVPLTEVAPDFVHPIWHKTNQQLLDECTDEGVVHKTTFV